jgi:hypothetical protein
MENENKRLHEWFGLCWHEPKRLTNEEREPICGFFGTIKGFKHPTLTATCVKCGDAINPINVNGVDTCYPRPKYHTESGFFALLSGLEKKRLMVTLMDWYYYEKLTFTAKIRTFAINAVEFEARADTLPEALFQAAIKALESEGTE